MRKMPEDSRETLLFKKKEKKRKAITDIYIIYIYICTNLCLYKYIKPACLSQSDSLNGINVSPQTDFYY